MSLQGISVWSNMSIANIVRSGVYLCKCVTSTLYHWLAKSSALHATFDKCCQGSDEECIKFMATGVDCSFIWI